MRHFGTKLLLALALLVSAVAPSWSKEPAAVANAIETMGFGSLHGLKSDGGNRYADQHRTKAYATTSEAKHSSLLKKRSAEGDGNPPEDRVHQAFQPSFLGLIAKGKADGNGYSQHPRLFAEQGLTPKQGGQTGPPEESVRS